MHFTRATKQALVGALFVFLSGGPGQAAQMDGEADSFKKMDADSDGFLTVGEAQTGLMSNDAFAEADKNKDGKLDYEEYMAAALKDETPNKPKAP